MRPDFGPRAWAGVALIALAACGGADEHVVARVGDETITVDEDATEPFAGGGLNRGG